jgi:hypothetical protein
LPSSQVPEIWLFCPLFPLWWVSCGGRGRSEMFLSAARYPNQDFATKRGEFPNFTCTCESSPRLQLEGLQQSCQLRNTGTRRKWKVGDKETCLGHTTVTLQLTVHPDQSRTTKKERSTQSAIKQIQLSSKETQTKKPVTQR